MYCYTHAHELTCIFNELQLWSHISSDHPNFLKTVAALTGVQLPNPVINQLDEIHKAFNELYDHVVEMKKTMARSTKLKGPEAIMVKKAIDNFLIHDTHAIALYPKLLDFGTEQMAWQELVKHITNEQAFMLELFKDLKKQL